MMLMLLRLIICVCYTVICAANAIIEENKLKGSPEWWYPQPNRTDFVLEGFCDRISYVAGSSITFKITSVKSIQQYSIRMYRLGYYGGSGARLIDTVDNVAAKIQPSCTYISSSHLTDCSNWYISTSWTIPMSAPTGVYVALPVHGTGKAISFGTYIPFVVKRSLTLSSDNQFKVKGSDILFKISDLTWLAYNLYGGYNVYKSTTDRSFSARASQASFNRPFQNRHAYPLGQHQNFLFGSEYAMIRWLEQHGYDVSYVACEDLELLHEANLLQPSNYRALLSVGHDEYWTQKMKDAFISARNQGVSLAFFSGNEGFWRVIWSDPLPITGGDRKALVDYYNGNKQSASRHRTIICRKETIDNVAAPTPDEWTGTFVDPRHRPADPENALSGQLFLVNSFRHESVELRREHMLLWFWRNATFVSPVENSVKQTKLSNATASHIANTHKRLHSKHKKIHADKSNNGKTVVSTGKSSGRRLESIHHRELRPSRSKNSKLASTKPVHVSPPGYLGYEMDIFVDDCYRPAGLIALSHTEKNITSALSEQYGASYKGSGVITHKLTLYRHIVRDPSSGVADTAPFNVTSKMVQICQSKRLFSPSLVPANSALVFGAGTIQWSWALSDWHDGLSTPTDPALQQATLNLLADMKVFPGSFHPRTADGSDTLLKYPIVSSDNLPPFSVITTKKLGPLSSTLHRHALVNIKGVAYDKGGGRVAAVEVSVNGGKNWHLASGKERWKFSFRVGELVGSDQRYGTHNCSTMNTRYMAETREESTGGQVIVAYRNRIIDSNLLYDPYSAHKYSFSNSAKKGGSTIKLLILSRAVDDRGHMEEVAYSRLYCALFSNHTEQESRNALLTNVVLAE